MIYSKINITPTVLPISNILTKVDNVEYQGLDISPDYQRAYIWNQEYKEKLILSLVLNYPIGNIVINQLSSPNKINAIEELVDGKQRLTTIRDFCNNNLEVKGKNAREVVETIKLIINNSAKEEEVIEKLNKKKKFLFKDLPKNIQNSILSYALPVYTMMSADRKQIKEYFKVLQNQDKLRAGEIINAIDHNPLSDYFLEIGNEFLNYINYSNLKRSEFEKVYYSVCATVLEKLPLNCSDKQVINFISNIKGLEENMINKIKIMNENLIHIKQIEPHVIKEKMSKRTLKMILGISAFHKDFFKDNTLNKLLFVIQFSSKLSAFNSSESDDNSFTKYYGDDFVTQKEKFLTNIAPNYRKIYNVFSKSTSTLNLKREINSIVEIWNKQ